MPAWRIHVQIGKRYAGKVRPALLRAAAQAALRRQAAVPGAELTIVLAGDALLRRLNKQFLGLDAPTDVLSFPSAAEARVAYLGDIAISYPRARAQARAAGHPLEAELRLLTVHGVLHLLGHDHARKHDQARMWAAQADILKELEAARR